MTNFEPIKARVSHDLLDLRQRLGGKVGVLTVGPDKVEVLKLSDNVYATTEIVRPAIRTMLAMEQGDIHSIRSHSDSVYFAERYKAFRGAQDAPPKTER